MPKFKKSCPAFWARGHIQGSARVKLHELSRDSLEELRHLSVGVPGDDGPVSVVLSLGLGELKVERVGAHLGEHFANYTIWK